MSAVTFTVVDLSVDPEGTGAGASFTVVTLGGGSSSGGGVTDHGALTGLGDDDHTQYLTNARGDARYDALGVAASAVSGEASARIAGDAASVATAATDATTKANAAQSAATSAAATDATTKANAAQAAAIAAAATDATSKVDAHVNDASAAHAASAIAFTPTGSLAATDVQAALAEAASEAAAALATEVTARNTAIASAIAALVASAPGVLDTLDEIAAALGDDPNFAATITTALAGKQASDAELTAIAGLASAANKLPYFTGSGTASMADFTAFARTLLDDADASAMRATLGLGTAATAASTDFQASDTELTAIAGLVSAADRLPYFTGSGTASLATFTTAGRALVDDADAAAQRTTLGLGTAATVNTGTSSGDLPLLSTGGRLPIARIASGTPDGTKFVRDDGTLVTPSGGGGAVATDAIFDAKGDLAVGTGADTAAKLTVGSNGKMIVADSTQTTGLAYANPGLLAAVSYGPAVQASVNTSSATMADIDASNFTVTFTAPPSGKVLITVGAWIGALANATIYDWGLREGSTTIADRLFLYNIGAMQGTYTISFLITGLTVGSSHTYKAAHRNSTGPGPSGIQWTAGSQEAWMTVQAVS
jgi:hypothetical protein